MKKLVLMIAFIMFFCGCSNKKSIVLLKKSIEYGDILYEKDLIEIKGGKLINPDNLVNIKHLGTNKISVKYKNNNSDKIKKYQFNLDVTDKTKPVIISSKTYYLNKGEDDDLTKYIFCGDNYDRNIKCNVEGFYDIDKLGEYNLFFTATDTKNNTTKKPFKLVVKEKTNSSYDNEEYDYNSFIKDYKDENNLLGIDVSTWQGDIDWEKVKSSGVSFAFIRIGFGFSDDGENVLDNKYLKNIKEAKEAGVKVGVYFYSYATSIDEVVDQANWVLKTLDNEKLDLPVAFDFEEWSSFDDYELNIYDVNLFALKFLDIIKENGYEGILYGSANYLNDVFYIKKYPYWLAHYTTKTDFSKPYKVWQVASNGIVSGIDGYVDLDILYE